MAEKVYLTWAPDSDDEARADELWQLVAAVSAAALEITGLPWSDLSVPLLVKRLIDDVVSRSADAWPDKDFELDPVEVSVLESYRCEPCRFTNYVPPQPIPLETLRAGKRNP